MTLRVALVGGPMYEHLYRALPPDTVEVVVLEDHPTLNRRVAEMLGAGERLDVISTHSKYAPSQAHWLRRLDDLFDAGVVGALAPGAVALCRFDGALLSLPRLIDVRVLWVRTDRVEKVPDTWAELLASDAVFGFPGRESGLFGTFFELVVGSGGRLFDDDLRPTMDTPQAVEAIEVLCRLAARLPQDHPDWHYDEVDAALLDGRLDAAAAWPGGWGAIAASPLIGHLRPFPYLSGPRCRVSYAGAHSWGIPKTCGDLDGAVDLLTRLVGAEMQAADAVGGSICAHEGAQRADRPVGEIDGERLTVTRRMIAEAMITYPPFARFPELEDAGWSALSRALRGLSTPAAAAATIQAVASEVLA